MEISCFQVKTINIVWLVSISHRKPLDAEIYFYIFILLFVIKYKS
jgi:hypothetical protein